MIFRSMIKCQDISSLPCCLDWTLADILVRHASYLSWSESQGNSSIFSSRTFVICCRAVQHTTVESTTPSLVLITCSREGNTHQTVTEDVRQDSVRGQTDSQERDDGRTHKLLNFTMHRTQQSNKHCSDNPLTQFHKGQPAGHGRDRLMVRTTTSKQPRYLSRTMTANTPPQRRVRTFTPPNWIDK